MVKAGRKFYLFLGIEGLLVLLVLVSFFLPHRTYEYGTEIYFSETTAPSGGIMESEHFALNPGSYRITVDYSSDADMTNTCDIYSGKLDARCLATNGMQFFQGLQEDHFDMWLYRKADDLRLVTEYHGPGEFTVRGFRIVETNACRGMALFMVLVISLLVDAGYFYVAYDRKKGFSREDKIVQAGLLITIFYAAYPLFGDYILSGGDLVYHLQRVEGIKDCLLHGIFPARISPEWQQGYGYASPIFYGETILYLAGVLRVIGFDVTAAFRIFMFVISTATVLLAYYSFSRILKDRYAGLVSCFLYATSVYRIYKVYYCESWGEMLGILLLPLILYGFYRIFAQNGSYVPLTAGLALLVQSHLLTGEMVGLFTIITCVVFWKKTFEISRFLKLAKAAVGAVLLSAWFLVPFADYMLTGNFVIQNVSARTIQYRGLLPAHLFLTFFRNGNNVFIDETGMYRTSAMGIGGVLMFVLFCFLYMWFFGRKEGLSETEWTASKVMAVYAVLAMVMSLAMFPWDRIQSSGQIAATLVSSIQFPNRFLTIANVMLCALAGMVVKHAAASLTKKQLAGFAVIAVILTAVSNLYLLEDEMERDDAIRVHNDEGMGTGYISGAEYLPYGADPALFMPQDPIADGDLFTDQYEKKTLGAWVYVENREQREVALAFPLLYYKGYQAYDRETGQKLPTLSGENFEVTVNIPPQFSGNIEVKFVPPVYWHAAELVSLLTLIVFLWSSLRSRRKAQA